MVSLIADKCPWTSIRLYCKFILFNRHICTHKSLLCDWLKVQIKFYYLFSILEECREYWLMTYRS